MELENKIIQRAELYLVRKGMARHIKHWSDYLKICDEFGIKKNYYGRTFVEEKDMPPLGRSISEWPEKELQVGPERIMFCVGPDDDFAKIKALGVTAIQSYVLPWINTVAYLDKAQTNGLKVLYSIADRIHNEILRTGDWDRNEVADIIEKCKDHTALWAWHVFEESNLPGREMSHQVQGEVYEFFKNRDSAHDVIQTLAGGTKQWDVINFNAMDWFIASTYVYDGTGSLWGMDPLRYLEVVAQEEREYINKNKIDKLVAFIFQCCDEPAANHMPPIEDSKVPLGHIEEQFNVLQKYGLFNGGLALWAWDHGYFGPATSDEMYQEIKNLFNKIWEG